MTPLRQQMIAVSVAGALCGAALATAALLIIQAAVFHSSCGLVPGTGQEASSSPSLPTTPPEPPSSPA